MSSDANNIDAACKLIMAGMWLSRISLLSLDLIHKWTVEPLTTCATPLFKTSLCAMSNNFCAAVVPLMSMHDLQQTGGKSLRTANTPTDHMNVAGRYMSGALARCASAPAMTRHSIGPSHGLLRSGSLSSPTALNPTDRSSGDSLLP